MGAADGHGVVVTGSGPVRGPGSSTGVWSAVLASPRRVWMTRAVLSKCVCQTASGWPAGMPGRSRRRRPGVLGRPGFRRSRDLGRGRTSGSGGPGFRVWCRPARIVGSARRVVLTIPALTPLPAPRCPPSTLLPLTAAVATRPGTAMRPPSTRPPAARWPPRRATASATLHHGPPRPGPAEVAARAGAVRGPLAGLPTTALLLADPGPDDGSPDAVAVTATRTPGRPYGRGLGGRWPRVGWNSQRLRPYVTDATVGEQLRLNGALWDLVKDHAGWIRVTLANATIATVYTILVPTSELLVLTSDSVHDQSTPRRPGGDGAPAPLRPADARGQPRRCRRDGRRRYRDDATALVLTAGP